MNWLRHPNRLAILIAGGVALAGFYLLNKQATTPGFMGTPRAPAPETAQRDRETGPARAAPPPGGPFRVVRVIDGDSLVLRNGEHVRLIGVDAPEMDHPDPRVQQYARKARDLLKELVEGADCRLEYEPEDLRDVHGRLLAYVAAGDRLVNAELIRSGHAYAYGKSEYSRRAQFLMLERTARRKHLGLWALSAEDEETGRLVARYKTLNAEGRKRLLAAADELVADHAAPVPDEPAPEAAAVAWRDADKHVGEYVTVTGTVVSTYNSGKACYLNFHKDYKKHLTAVIFASAFHRFAEEPERYFDGKQVRVTGLIQEYGGRPEIVVEYPFQLETIAKPRP
ncbi:MAG: thermonuclease family protein [Kiritimatiellae bacterium]|nr:thermonuclease family protein [Kiritimatiellia bacterium]